MTIHVPKNAVEALSALEAAGFESYVVGGCVRDALLGREPHDWDITTAAAPEQVEAVFAGARILETGLKHGTVTLLSGGEPLEITTFRSEGAYSDGRRPDSVTFVMDIHQDLLRRDFTVNAMAYSPLRGLRDDFGGQADLAAGLLRCVGDPDERLTEDALRILRGLRFAARYGFTVEQETDAALRRHRDRLSNVSPERIFAELKGILTGPGAGEMMLAYPEIFFTVFPEMAPMLGFDQHRPQAHQYDVWGHTAHAVDATPPAVILRLAMFFHDCGKPATFSQDPESGKGRFFGHPQLSAAMADAMLRRMRCDNATRETVTALVENHEMLTGHSKKALRRLLVKLGEERLRLLFDVCRADAAAHTPEVFEKRMAVTDSDQKLLDEILADGSCLSLKDLAIGGRELVALGLAPGPEIGAVLHTLLEEVTDEILPNERESLLRRATEIKGGL